MPVIFLSKVLTGFLPFRFEPSWVSELFLYLLISVVMRGLLILAFAMYFFDKLAALSIIFSMFASF
jgi:hypothetical protein